MEAGVGSGVGGTVGRAVGRKVGVGAMGWKGVGVACEEAAISWMGLSVWKVP